MAMRLTQPLTEISTRDLRKVRGGKGWPARKADNLTAICVDYLENVGDLTSLNPIGLHGLLQG
jgi:hypothetical protein